MVRPEVLVRGSAHRLGQEGVRVCVAPGQGKEVGIDSWCHSASQAVPRWICEKSGLHLSVFRYQSLYRFVEQQFCQHSKTKNIPWLQQYIELELSGIR